MRAVSERLRADGVTHEMLVVPGNHDYEFNRGPGGAEMLVWHELVSAASTCTLTRSELEP